MIDLHTHVLPGIDDGPPDLDTALALLTRMAEEGVDVVVATPHVSEQYPTTAERIAEGVSELRNALADAGVPLEVLPGAEVALDRAVALGDDELDQLCLGEGRFLLVESPLASSAADFDWILDGLRERGFSLVLAHPERSPAFQRDPARLLRHVAAGDLCSITAGAMAGRFGTTVRRFTLRLLREGMIHDVASDAHDLVHRPPGLRIAFESFEQEAPGMLDRMGWHTLEVPEAILAGRRPPAQPPLPEITSQGRWPRRFLRRRQ